MKRFLALFLLLLLSACGPEPTVETEGPWSFGDDTGALITLRARPEKVAVLFSSYAEIWTLAGGEVAVTVGESVERGFAPEGTTLVDAGAGKTIDHELLLAAQPDLVIGSADIAAQAELPALLKASGIPCALFRVDTFEDYLRMLKTCTELTGNAAAYERYGSAVAEEVNAVKAAVAAQAEPPDILFIRAGSQYSATKAKRAPDNFVCTMLDELGSHNIADEAAVLLDGLSLEEILLRNPDCIFITTMGSEEAAKSYVNSLFAQPGWRELDAVAGGRYSFLPKELFHFKPNARWGEAYALLAKLLYPEQTSHG